MLYLKRHSQSIKGISCTGGILALVLVLILMSPQNGLAQTGICAKDLGAAAPSFDGIVAPGASGAGCTPDPVWSDIAPAEFEVAGLLPKAHLYLAYESESYPTSRLHIGVAVKGDSELSEFDYFLMFFDADNSDDWGDGDFAILIKVCDRDGSAGKELIDDGKKCSGEDIAEATYWRYDSSADPSTRWKMGPDTASAEIEGKITWDYTTADEPEKRIWNLEIHMPVGTPAFNLATTGNFFGVGAYLFVDRGHLTAEPQTGQVRWWPNDGLPDPLPASVPTPPAIPINAVTPRLLDFTYDDPETTDVAEHRPQADRLADVSLQNVCYDVNFDVSFPWKINGQAAASHDDRIKRGLSNTFTVTFRFDGPGPDPNPPANTGTVELRLKPYGNLGTGSQVEWIKEETGISANYDAARSVDFIYDFSKTPGTQDGPPSEWADYGEFSFICATMKLKDFPLDDDKSYNSNVENVNWNYFETSEYKQTFYITADGIPGLNPGESTTILLHAEMNNEGQNIGLMLASVLSPVATPIGVLVLSAAVLTTLLLVRLKRTGTTSYKYALLLVVLLVLGVTASCAIICKTCAIICKEKQPTSRWEFGNARELGITPMEGEPGWYEVPIRFGEIKGVELEVNGMPLPYRTQQIQLLPTASDNRPNMLPLQVKPQQVVTIVALGNIDLDGPGGPLEPTSAHGFIRRDTTGQQRYLLRDGYYTPSEYAGALIGSFDGFRKTSFVVGRTASIMVPEGANTLTLAVNAIRGTYELVSGSFELSIIRTPPPQVPTFDDMQGDGTYEVPHTFSLWDTLTSLSVYTYYETVQLNETDMAVSRTRHPLAFSHYAVYDSHNQRVRQPGLVRMRQ